ncbi:hypothetical protein ACTG16_23860 [Aeromonas sp. 23P]|uniref:hypothetical protein n=1 Tax=Aeromonas sp. 23P TaxID=3452716 RepID=UPI003F790E43|nr:hypothetical protein [Aeromonas veronii]
MYGNTVGDAANLFKYLCGKHGISAVNVRSDEALTMDMMGEPKGFLPIWMIKVEQYWSILSDKKIWSAKYRLDDDSVCGVVAEDNNDDFSDVRSDGLPVSLRYLFGKFAMQDMIAVENNVAFIKDDTRIYYNLNEENNEMELLDAASYKRLSFISIMHVMSESLDKMHQKAPVADYEAYLDDSTSRIKEGVESSRGIKQDNDFGI